MVLALRLLNRKIVDACKSQPHQAARIKLPIFVAVGAEPIPGVIVPFVGEANGNAIPVISPEDPLRILAITGSRPVRIRGVFGIGPGLVFTTDKLWLYLNSYFETGAENRPEGIKITLRISKAF